MACRVLTSLGLNYTFFHLKVPHPPLEIVDRTNSRPYVIMNLDFHDLTKSYLLFEVSKFALISLKRLVFFSSVSSLYCKKIFISLTREQMLRSIDFVFTRLKQSSTRRLQLMTTNKQNYLEFQPTTMLKSLISCLILKRYVLKIRVRSLAPKRKRRKLRSRSLWMIRF